ncbi:MAG: glycosyltransferase family 4 protein [Elusimicrobia bacterium]|nr:glycosyltransferase family 4 protein [Elusimicrobiota bacterium]
MDKIKVIHIITLLELGGAQQNTLYTCEHLNKNNFEAILICGKGGILDKKTKNIKTYFIPELIRKISPLYDLIALIKIYKILKKEKPDIIHTHSSKAGILGRWAAYIYNKFEIRSASWRTKSQIRIKVIHTFHGFAFHDYQNWLIRKFYILLERWTAKISDSLIAVSRENISKGLKNKIGTKEKYTLIRSGIKLQDYTIETDIKQKKRQFGINDENVVGMVACFKPQKAPLDFIKTAELVCRELPDTKFMLIGDGILKKQINGSIKKLSLEKNFILTGWRQDVNEIIKIFDIFVLTSLWEGLPRVIIEAMATGIPVVATYVDGTREVVREGLTGFIVKPHETEKMAERILRLLKNSELRQNFSREARKLTAEFDIDLMVAQQEKLYLPRPF